jgi:hypothetical protein
VSFIQPRRAARQALSVAALGFGWAYYAPLVLDPNGRLAVRVVRHSIRHDILALTVFDELPAQGWQLLYLAAISFPFLLSPYRPFRLFGLTLAASGVISHLVFRHAFESVWCFFAAALSLQLCYAFRDLHARREGPSVGPAAPSP